MQTLVRLSNSNCPWCLNSTVRRLRTRREVTSVHSHASAGCIIVDHEDDDSAALVAQIGRDLRAVELASNGERVMSPVDVDEVAYCRDGRPETQRTEGQ